MSEAPRVSQTQLDTEFGNFEFYCFSWSKHEEDNILCEVKRPLGDCPLVRVQSACYTAEIFRSRDCDCHEQLEASLRTIASDGGIFVYMLCDGRGAGLYRKVQGLELGRTRGLDTSDAYRELKLPQDPREYGRVAEVLKYFGVQAVRLLTNNPRKISGLEASGIDVAREPLEIEPTAGSRSYLLTKALKMGHMLSWARETEGEEHDPTGQSER
jgi:GTP cyclohydrolase II